MFVPPLRERPEDLPLLVDHFVSSAVEEFEGKRPQVPNMVYGLLQRYNFPGNVRELRSMIFDAVSRTRFANQDGLTLPLGSFYEVIGEDVSRNANPRESSSLISFPEILPTIRQVTDLLVEEAMRRCDGKQTVASELIGISQQALSKRLKRKREETTDMN